MAGSLSDGISNGQQLSGEALAEWRSSEQVENGIASTSPPYWDTTDDDDCGPKPAELYGKYTWKIDKFSQINKRELRSNAFEVGGYKWYILIYPQGCDVCNHLSLFLCVANHDKLLPGWSHFAQFTIAVVNKDPKKSKYSDTLHRFWKKEHDWGWKKFMELSKVLDGFVDADTLIIKAQVQVIRERPDRPFRCLDFQYRRELVRVYLSNVEQICRRFVEERRGRLGKLSEDKVRWSSFCSFWLGIDENGRRRMSREKSDLILKLAVKHFFIDKEVTSTLVMDSLYSGLKALEAQTQTYNKKAKANCLDAERVAILPIVRLEKDTFILVDDVLLLLERAALEPLPPKDEKGPQNHTKDGGSGEDYNKDSIERDERRLTELGRGTIEIFVLAHIFSKIDVAYQEAVALKRQEELIREEEAAWMTGIEQKAKRAASDKEKKLKKKQGKQKRNNRKLKDRGKEEKPQKQLQDTIDAMIEDAELLVDKCEDVSDVSDSVNCELAPDEALVEPDSSTPVHWDTDILEAQQPPTEAVSSGVSCLTKVVHNGGYKSPSVKMMDDGSSSTCSTDSLQNQKSLHKSMGEEEIVSLQKEASLKDEIDHEALKENTDIMSFSRKSPLKTSLPSVHLKTTGSDPAVARRSPSDKSLVSSKPYGHKNGIQKSSEKAAMNGQPVVQKTMEKPPVSVELRPLVPGPRPPPSAVVSTVHAPPFLPRSVSATAPQSYRNAMMGNPTTTAIQPHSPSLTVNSSHSSSYSQPQPASMFLPQTSESLSIGMVVNNHDDVLQNGFQWMESSLQMGMGGVDPCLLLNDIQNIDLNNPTSSHLHFSNNLFIPPPAPGHGNGVLADEFPHLDIINELLDDEYAAAAAAAAVEVSPLFHSFSNGPHQNLTRHFTYPGGVDHPTISCSYNNNNISYGEFDLSTENVMVQLHQPPSSSYMNGGHIDGLIHNNQWQQMGGCDVFSNPSPPSSCLRNANNDIAGYEYCPDYSSNLMMMMGVNNGYVYHPSNTQ